MKAIETALTLTKAYKLAIERFEKMLGQGFVSAVTAMNEFKIIICGCLAAFYTSIERFKLLK